MNFNTVKVTLPADIHDRKLRNDSFNPSRGWVFSPFVTLPVSVVLFTQIIMLYR